MARERVPLPWKGWHFFLRFCILGIVGSVLGFLIYDGTYRFYSVSFAAVLWSILVNVSQMFLICDSAHLIDRFWYWVVIADAVAVGLSIAGVLQSEFGKWPRSWQGGETYFSTLVSMFVPMAGGFHFVIVILSIWGHWRQKKRLARTTSQPGIELQAPK